MKHLKNPRVAVLALSLTALATVPAAWWYPGELVCSAFPVFCNR